MGRIETCLRYVTDITGPDLLFGGVGGGVILKIEVFVTYERDQILMKFDI